MTHPSTGRAKSGSRPPDPAEKGWLRWYYHNWRPTLWGRISNSVWAWFTSLGVLSPALLTLQVADRRTGQSRSTVLAVVEHEGNRYLVSMLGDTSEWVQNIRAAVGKAFIKRGSAIEVRLIEIPVEARAPVLRAWCQVALSGRRHLPVPYDAPVEAFEAISPDYPVFRIDPSQASAKHST